MTRAAYFRANDTAADSGADLRLIPVALAAYAAAWLGDSTGAADGLTLAAVWCACGVGGVCLLMRGGVRSVFVDRRASDALDGRMVEPTNAVSVRRRTTAALLIVGACVGIAATARVAALDTGPLPALAASHAKATVEFVVTDDPRTIPSKRPGQGPLTLIPARAEFVTSTQLGTSARHGASTTPETSTRLGASTQLGMSARPGASANPVPGARIRSPITVMASVSASVTTSSHAVEDQWRGLLPSTRVRVTGKLGPAGDGWPDAAILSTRLAPEIVAGPSLVQRIAGRLRQGLRDACADLPADQRGLIPGLVIGDVSGEPPSLADAFRATGLTHLTAVSGENLTFMLGATMPLARLAGLRGRAVTVIGLATVAGFTILARPEPSVVRAGVMALLTLTLVATGRRARGIPVLCAGTLILLLADPWLARSYGFALSLAATTGMFILAPGWQDKLILRGVSHHIAESLACTAAAETFCLPILVALTSTITPLSLPANLLAEFCVGPATVLGAATLAASAIWLPLGRACAWLAQWPTEGLVSIARYGSQLPFASVHWPGGAAGTGLLLAVYAVVAVLVTAVGARRASRLSRNGAG